MCSVFYMIWLIHFLFVFHFLVDLSMKIHVSRSGNYQGAIRREKKKKSLGVARRKMTHPSREGLCLYGFQTHLTSPRNEDGLDIVWFEIGLRAWGVFMGSTRNLWMPTNTNKQNSKSTWGDFLCKNHSVNLKLGSLLHFENLPHFKAKLRF